MSAATVHCSFCCSRTAIDIASSRLRARSSGGNGSTSHSRGRQTGTRRLELPFLVGLDVVLEVNAGIERPVRLLRLVFEINLGKRQTHVLRQAALAVALCHARDDHVVHLEDEEILLALPRFPMGDRRILDMHTGRARFQEHRRRLVDIVGKREIAEVRLAHAATTPAASRAGVRHTPRPAQDLDLVFVLVVQRFALDVPDLRENVRCHDNPPDVLSMISPSPLGDRRRSRASAERRSPRGRGRYHGQHVGRVVMAADIFAKIGDIKGESLDDKHKDQIEILSWSWGVTNASATSGGSGSGVGKPHFSDFSFTHNIDKASPVLLKACATGVHIKDATITHRKPGKGQKDFLIFKMNDVIITSVTQSDSESGLPENVSLTFSKIDLEYKPQKPDGSLDAGVHFKYDIKANKEG